ncbi:MAG: RNA-directed DNA polymerase [Bacteroidia bacterium]|nr:RNA-directed DNA polymerase [Bacteroidia bacterium]
MLQPNLFSEIEKERIALDLFQAYFDARKNKRNTINALLFEKHLESNVFALLEEIVNYQYKPKPSICFIVDKPVKREIFAADFRDRVIHHLIYNYISPLFETVFINDCYSCRKGKGTHYGIQRMDHFIRSCSHNYSLDCYMLKLDIKGYFMSIDKIVLFNKVREHLKKKLSKIDFDLTFVFYLIEQTLFCDPKENCIIKGKKADWKDLPKTKSLFYARKNCGLPIGNLTSQLFANIYLNDFDHWVKSTLGIKCYGRYVDDFVLIHPDNAYLKKCIPLIKKYLTENLGLTLHPDKIYFQHYTKGLRYLGAVIKPHRIYIANQTKGNYFEAIQLQNKIARDHKPTHDEKAAFLCTMNSYLGIMRHYKTYKHRKSMLFKNLSAWWWNYVYLTGGISKFVFILKPSFIPRPSSKILKIVDIFVIFVHILDY